MLIEAQSVSHSGPDTFGQFSAHGHSAALGIRFSLIQSSLLDLRLYHTSAERLTAVQNDDCPLSFQSRLEHSRNKVAVIMPSI